MFIIISSISLYFVTKKHLKIGQNKGSNHPLFYLFTISKDLLMVRFFIFFVPLSGFTFSKDLLMVRFFIFLYSIWFYLVRFFMKGKKAHH